MGQRVLVVEDDPAISELVCFHLKRGGFAVRAAATAGEARGAFRSWAPDAVVLDIMLPDASGLDLCREMRDDAAVILLTALGDEADRVAGLETGADDYVTKPFSPRELVARVRAVLRRRGPQTARGVLAAGPVTVDRERVAVTVDGRPVGLTTTEFKVVAALAEAAGRVLSRQQILDQVWGPDFFGDPRTVDVHIRHIREKLAAAGAPDAVETVRGFGFRLRTEDR
jgi:DNA-binding response OmpR family regulator